jgi:multiple sugar transport system substrate-binding protein
MVDPVRQSIWDNPDFQKKMAEAKDYYKTFVEISKGDARIQFTPQPLFFETTTEWAATLQDIYGGTVTVEDGLNKLVDKLTGMLKQAGIYQE